MELDELKLHVWRGKCAVSARKALSTGFAALDNRLPGGGWPVGALIEVLVDRYGIGELKLLLPALAVLTQPDPSKADKWVAWVAPPFIPYAPALQRYGIATERLLLIHPSASKDRLWAVEQVVRSGSSVGVLAWLAAAEHVALRRLQLAAEVQGCWTVLFRPLVAQAERSPAALRIAVSQHDSVMRVEIVKCRGGFPGSVDLEELGLTAAAGSKR